MTKRLHWIVLLVWLDSLGACAGHGTNVDSDAGGSDAGRNPAKSDAGAAVDGGKRDAGTKDAGTKDAGTKDAGAKDAGAKDAGTPPADSGHADGCASNPCGDHASCEDQNGTAKCACESGYQDNDHDNRCVPDCGGDTCSSHGACSAETGTVTCSCSAGWSGDDCATPSCDQIECSSHGSCATGSGSAVCTCDAGWSGVDCAAPSCAAIDCAGHGTCATSSGSAVCTCSLGWSGNTCAAPDCTGISCSGHGTCATTTGVSACTCSTGWSGATCATADCAGVSCSGHGSCGTGSGTAACTCNAGWSGAVCATPDCTGISCSSHGTCAIGTGTAICNCTSGWSGGDCATPDCAGITCSGHGSCGTGGGTATCSCGSGWSGSACATPSCDGITCFGHGTCATDTGTAICTCDGGFTGSHCGCSGACAAHSTCDESGNTPACACDPGYQDEDHDNSCAPDCTGITCSNHGSCATSTGAALCTCSGGWTGDACAAPSCSGIGCSGHGMCGVDTGSAVCTCDAGYSGTACATACASGTFGEHCEFHIVYGLDLPTNASWPTLADVPYDIDHSAELDRPFDRVGYRLVLDSRYLWAEMDPFTRQRSQLGVPVDWIWDQAVTHLSVRTNASGVAELRDASGSIEFWPNCYSQGANNVFDSDDDIGADDCYGSMQVHHAPDTLLAINGWNNQTTLDLGIGDNSATPNTDWTGTQNAASYTTTRRLEVYVHDTLNCAPSICAFSHQVCSDSSGAAVCSCDQGYSGSTCTSCTSGYQDNDANGSCMPACTSNSCPNPGDVCADASGTLRCLQVAGTSCADILSRDASAASGSYLIDPDGTGGADPLVVTCDMTTAGGGWIVVSTETFPSDPAPGWSDGRVDATSACATAYSSMLGGVGLFGQGADTSRTYDLHGLAHSQAYVSLDYVVIDSWDGENAIVNVDGSNVYTHAFDAANGSVNVCGVPWLENGPQQVVAQLAHSADSLTLEVTSTLDQDASDESFGVDNVRILIR